MKVCVPAELRRIPPAIRHPAETHIVIGDQALGVALMNRRCRRADQAEIGKPKQRRARVEANRGSGCNIDVENGPAEGFTQAVTRSCSR
jgi:hypothetical protein